MSKFKGFSNCPLRLVVSVSLTSVALVLGIGCQGSDRFANRKLNVKTIPLKGVLKIDGQVASHASLSFRREDSPGLSGQASGDLLGIGATTNEQGEFEVVTEGMNRGLPEGTYKIAISWPDPSVKLSRDGDDKIKDLAPRKYRSYDTTDLTVTVVPSEQPPLDLQISSRK
ncbi:MAG: hypothetical protein FJ267_08770 [Planctomycetes bacterium]|nr:hypothetical protein [Planctomycetota bacterium]